MMNVNKQQHANMHAARKQRALVLNKQRINQLSNKTKLLNVNAGFPASGPQIGPYPGSLLDEPVLDRVVFSTKAVPVKIDVSVEDVVRSMVNAYKLEHDIDEDIQDLILSNPSRFNTREEAHDFFIRGLTNSMRSKVLKKNEERVDRITRNQDKESDKVVMKEVDVLRNTSVTHARAKMGTAASIIKEAGSGVVVPMKMPFRVRPTNVVVAMEEFQKAMKVRKDYRFQHTDAHKLKRSGRTILVPDGFNEQLYRRYTLNACSAWNALAIAKLSNCDSRKVADRMISMPVPPLPSYDDGKAFRDPVFAEDAYLRKKESAIDHEGHDEVVKRTRGSRRQNGFDRKNARLGLGLASAVFSGQIGSASAYKLDVSGYEHEIFVIVVLIGVAAGFYIYQRYSRNVSDSDSNSRTLVSDDFIYDDNLTIEEASADPLLSSTQGYGNRRAKAGRFIQDAAIYQGQGGGSKIKRQAQPRPEDKARADIVNRKEKQGDKIDRIVAARRRRRENKMVEQEEPVCHLLESGFRIGEELTHSEKRDLFVEKLKRRPEVPMDVLTGSLFGELEQHSKIEICPVIVNRKRAVIDAMLNERAKPNLLPHWPIDYGINRFISWSFEKWARNAVLSEIRTNVLEVKPVATHCVASKIISMGLRIDASYLDLHHVVMREIVSNHCHRALNHYENIEWVKLTYDQENIKRFTAKLNQRKIVDDGMSFHLNALVYNTCMSLIRHGERKLSDNDESNKLPVLTEPQEEYCSPIGRLYASPVSRTLFDKSELFSKVNGVDRVKTKIIVDEHDMGGPWCGPVCVRAALGRGVNLMAMAERFKDTIGFKTCSTLKNVNNYAKEEGVNVLFKVYTLNGYKYVSNENNKCWKWCVLIYRVIDGVGHYLLGYDSKQSSYSDNVRFVDEYVAKHGVRVREQMRLTDGYKIRTTGRFVNLDNNDHRALMDSRDPISTRGQDCLEEFVIKRGTYVGVGNGTWTGYNYHAIKWLCSYTEESVVISKMRLAEALRAIQSVHDEASLEVALNVVDRSNGINTPSLANGDMVIKNTKMIARLLAPPMTAFSFHIAPRVHYNIPNDNCYVDDKILETIAENQALGVKGLGTAAGGDLPGINYFVKIPKKITVKRGYVTARAPLGAIETSDGTAAAGLLPVTDHAGLISCLSNRYIQRSLVARDDSLHKLFVRFSKAANFYLLENLEVTAEPSLAESFAKVSEGKRSRDEIALVLTQYDQFKRGLMTPKEVRKFQQVSMFNKLEDNSKLVGDSYHNKHRGITTMSDEMCVVGSGIPLASQFIFKGNANRFTIKETTPEDMIRKIMDVSSDDHIVTDFSSFEATFDLQQREVLGNLLNDFAVKYNWPMLARSIPKLVTYDSLTVRSNGLEAELDALGSGLYCTALISWTTNVLLGLFGSVFADLRTKNMSNEEIVSYIEHTLIPDENRIREYWTSLNVIMEGDDGLIRKSQTAPDIITRLGFKLSISQEGTKPGDCDFLSSRWMNGKRFLNTGKYLCRFLWVRSTQNLSIGKQLYVLRCMAASLYHMSPGHPVLMALVEFIGKVTKHANPFKNYKKYLDVYKFPGYDTTFPTNFDVDDSMRLPIAEGGAGFIGICLSDQYILEKNIREGNFFVGDVFCNDENVTKLVASSKSQNATTGENNFRSIMKALGVGKYEISTKNSY